MLTPLIEPPCLGHDPIAAKRLATASRRQWRLWVASGTLRLYPGQPGQFGQAWSGTPKTRFTNGLSHFSQASWVWWVAVEAWGLPREPAFRHHRLEVFGFSELAMQAIRFTKIRGNPFFLSFRVLPPGLQRLPGY